MPATPLIRALTICAGSAALGAAAVSSAQAQRAAACPELAADVEVALVSKAGADAGRVRITGVVRNRGDVAWHASGPAHYLQMALAQSDSEARPDGEPVQPLVPIQQLAPGQQYRIDHQVNWVSGQGLSYPRFVARFSEVGAPGTSPCRWERSRREITPIEIDRLFHMPPPNKALDVKSYRMLGGVGVNTLETHLSFRRKSSIAGRITASVGAPYTGASTPVPVSGSNGQATIRVHITCGPQNTPIHTMAPVLITYRLWGSLNLPGGSGWVPSYSLEHRVPYDELCDAAVVKTQP